MGMFEKFAKSAIGAVSRTVERNGGISGCCNKLAEAGRREQARQMVRESQRMCDYIDRLNKDTFK